MKKEVKTQTTSRKQYVTFPFEFLGNRDGCKVCMSPGSRGDGEIGTGSGGKKYARLSANVYKYDSNYLKFVFTYQVWEDQWNSKRNRDALYFTKEYFYDLRDYNTKDKKVHDNVTKYTTVSWSLPYQGEAVYKDYYNASSERHGFLPFDSRSYPRDNNLRNWLPANKLRFKIDDKGNELRAMGNIGVRGMVGLYINVDTTIRTETLEDDPVNSMLGLKRRKGTCDVVQSIPKEIRSSLCHGYDITGEYASPYYIRAQVLNLDVLNEDKHLAYNYVNRFSGTSFTGSSVKEINESREKSLGVSLSVGLKGFSFSTEMKKTFKVEHQEKYGYKYACMKDLHDRMSYHIELFKNPAALYSYINQNFLDDLDSKSAAQIIKDYGTHVMLGGILGARLNYDMRYRESMVAHSEAKTFTTNSSIGFKRGSSQLSSPGGNSKSTAADFYANITKLLANNPDAATIKAIAQLSSNFAKQTGSNAGTGGGWSVNVGASTSQSSSSSTSFENETTEIKCDGVGGNSMYCKMMVHDVSAFDKWVESVNDNTCVWCDYVPGTLVPIYKFVPMGYRNTAQDIKNAMEEYIIETRIRSSELGHGVQLYNVTLRNGNKCFNFSKETGGNADPEISTQNNKSTGWKIKMELVNLPEGHIGVAVWFNVVEGGNFSSNRTHLQLRDVIDVTNGMNRQCAIDPSIYAVWESREFSIRGQQHGWIDVSSEMRTCPFINLSNSNRFLIKIDGGGDDYNNIGFSGTLKVPYVYYLD